jgi:hypothetical protein
MGSHASTSAVDIGLESDARPCSYINGENIQTLVLLVRGYSRLFILSIHLIEAWSWQQERLKVADTDELGSEPSFASQLDRLEPRLGLLGNENGSSKSYTV